MAHSSTIQVLKVVNEQRKTREGKDYTVRMAECVLYTDDGEVEVAGPLRLSEELVNGLKPGWYRAGFSMVRSFADATKNELVSKCVSLTPVPVKGAPVPVSTPKASA